MSTLEKLEQIKEELSQMRNTFALAGGVYHQNLTGLDYALAVVNKHIVIEAEGLDE